jgi:hypothetical protein
VIAAGADSKLRELIYHFKLWFWRKMGRLGVVPDWSSADRYLRNPYVVYYRAGDEPDCIALADGSGWDPDGYGLDGWYIWPFHGDPGSSRPIGPFETKRAARAWSRANKFRAPDPQG